MTANARLGAVRVWVMKPRTVNTSTGREAYAFDWNTANFVEELRLIPQRTVEQACSMGTATFRLLRRNREENGYQYLGDPGYVIPGAYIAVTAGTATFDATKVTWWGWITGIDATGFAGTADQMGTVTACELGALLDQTQIFQWKQQALDNGYAVPINNPPTANYSVSDGVVIGNAVYSPNDSTGMLTADKCYVFTRLPANCGTSSENIWTSYRLLKHVVTFASRYNGENVVNNIPPITLNIPAGVLSYMNDTSIPEVFDLRGLTLKGAFDMLIPRSRGLGWAIKPDAATPSNWKVTVWSHDYDGTFLTGAENAGNPITPANYPTTSVQYTESGESTPDAIVIRGEPIVCGVTVGYPDGNIDRGWSQTQEDNFKTGKSTGVTPEALYRNNVYRTSPELDRVFTIYGLYAYNANVNGDISRRDPPGDGSGTTKPLVPQIIWNGTTVTVDDSTNRQPYLPTARLTRTIPWPKGLKPDFTDTRSPAGKVQPEYMAPLLFRYMASPPPKEPYEWLALSAHGMPPLAGLPPRDTPSISADDRSLGLRIEYSPAETLALNHWSNAGDGTSIMYPDSPETNRAGKCLDWKTLVFTVGIESDQRLEVTVTRPGLTGDDVRRKLVIEDPRLKFWFVLKNTILGIKASSDNGPFTVDPLSATNINDASTGTGIAYATRNDFPTAQKLANMVASWEFRKRVSMSITVAQPDSLPAFATLGYMISTVIESASVAAANRPEQSVDVYTVVETISIDWSENPTATISTAYPERPSLPLTGGYGGGMSSPVSGGSVSPSLGGTTPQVVNSLRRDVDDIKNALQSVPLIPARKRDSTTSVYTIAIDGGNLLDDGITNGIVYSSSEITSVPSAYDPNITSSFIDGIGRGTLYINGVVQTGYVLIVNDTRSVISNAVFNGDICVAAPDLVTIPVDSSTDTISCYFLLTP